MVIRATFVAVFGIIAIHLGILLAGNSSRSGSRRLRSTLRAPTPVRHSRMSTPAPTLCRAAELLTFFSDKGLQRGVAQTSTMGGRDAA